MGATGVRHCDAVQAMNDAAGVVDTESQVDLECGAMPIARVQGTALLEFPKDLYIPPEALEVFLETFEGPLDLLLYLIRRQNLDILDIPIAEVTRQYMEYIELMNELRLELAADYLVMAAMLAQIKSQMLMPRPESVEEAEEDPRAELVRRLREYEQIRQAAEDLDGLPRLERDTYGIRVEPMLGERPRPQPDVALNDILTALQKVLQRSQVLRAHRVKAEPLSVRERMANLLDYLRTSPQVEFTCVLRLAEGRSGVVVTLLALLELVKGQLVVLTQAEPFAPIEITLSGVERTVSKSL